MQKFYCVNILVLLFFQMAVAQVPVIQSFSPLSGTVSSQVVIRGIHFSSVADNNTVYFGTVKAAVTAAADTSVTVTVPAGSCYSPISVKVDSLTAFSKLPFITIFGNGASLLSNSFEDPVFVAAAQSPCLGDFDNDGFIDMAAIITGNKMCIFKNTDSAGIRVYRPLPSYASVTNPKQVITADFNGDGKLDVLVSGGGAISVFKNISSNGNLLFQNQVLVSFSSNTNIFSMAAGDIDGNGKPDLVLSYDHSSTSFSVARNTGLGDSILFGGRTGYPFGSVPGGSGTVGDGNKLFLADVDGDGKLDVSVVSRFFPPFLIYRNTSSPGAVSFAANVAITSNKNYSTGNGFYDLKLADMDGDNKPEILYVSSDSSLLSYYRNTSAPGSISFTSKTSLAVSGSPTFIAVNDMNGDGKADVAVMTNGVHIFQNSSQAGVVGFKSPKVFGGYYSFNLGLADMDADGKADIIASGYYPSSYYLNKTFIHYSNAGEPGPVNLCVKDSTVLIESDIEGNLYQWQVDTGNGFENIIADTIYAATNTAALQVSHLKTSWAGYEYRCLVDGHYSTVQALKFVAVFYGSYSSAWEYRLNWSCGQLPDAYSDVIINAQNTVLSSNAQVRSIKLIANGTLFVKQPYHLQVMH